MFSQLSTSVPIDRIIELNIRKRGDQSGEHITACSSSEKPFMFCLPYLHRSWVVTGSTRKRCRMAFARQCTLLYRLKSSKGYIRIFRGAVIHEQL